MRIFIDADGCPVVDLTIQIAKQYQIPVTILCDTSHLFSRTDADIITVSKGADAVDFSLVNLLKSGDLVVTQDYGLAAMCLARGAVPIHQNGMVYSGDNIDALLSFRHASKKIRNAGGRLKGPKKRSRQDDEAFQTALYKILKNQTG